MDQENPTEQFISMQDLETDLGVTRPTLLRRLKQAGIPLYRKQGRGVKRYVKRTDLDLLLTEEFVIIEKSNVIVID